MVGAQKIGIVLLSSCHMEHLRKQNTLSPIHQHWGLCMVDAADRILRWLPRFLPPTVQALSNPLPLRLGHMY